MLDSLGGYCHAATSRDHSGSLARRRMFGRRRRIFQQAAPLLQSASDGADWLVPGKTYGGNRLTTLTQIDPSNVATLKKAWVTAVKDDGEEEASPIVWNGTVFMTTSHDNVLAMDGKSGTLKWAYGYSPAYELQYPVNRGVGLSDGKLYIVTQDCRLVAIVRAPPARKCLACRRATIRARRGTPRRHTSTKIRSSSERREAISAERTR